MCRPGAGIGLRRTSRTRVLGALRGMWQRCGLSRRARVSASQPAKHPQRQHRACELALRHPRQHDRGTARGADHRVRLASGYLHPLRPGRENDHDPIPWAKQARDRTRELNKGQALSSARDQLRMAKPLNVAMIGYGFMGRAHSNAYRKVNQFFELDYRPVLKVACARNREKLSKFAANWGWEETETDWRKVIARKDVDAIDIGSPNNTHKEITLAAAAAGKMVLCEKPLAMNLAEAAQMTEAVEKAGVANFVWFNYRRVPAIALAKQIVDEGRLGRVFHYRACYLQDWTISPDLPQGGQTLWRLDRDVAGSGVTGDLISHSVDTAIWLNGPMVKVVADTETF